MTPHDILKQVFGHSDFRGPQLAIINDVLAGRDVVAIMPTGAGKSICYQAVSYTHLTLPTNREV